MYLHTLHRRLLAEELVRLRRADEHQRYAAAQRRGRIDPNPHQIDAVVFALQRIPEGGCILADEVGLGKTIEAGLVIAQLLAEGMRRVLIVVPKSLQGQWQTELYALFGIETSEGRLDPEAFEGPGVFLVHRDLAGGTKGASILKSVDPFDLVVVDEAHEIFAGLYRRFDKEGLYKEDSRDALIAGRVRDLVQRGGTPMLLLTATPIQNSLAELWGLVQYVEPTGTLLGKLSTFREIFCDGSDRSVVPEQAPELRRRLGTVMQRTLRRHAQEFLEVPFVDRQSRLIEYSMSPDEKALYNDVTAWLMRPDLCAFRGSQRLLLIGFHRRMASSIAALTASLNKVADRLRSQLDRIETVKANDRALEDEFAQDLEEEPEELTPPTSVEPPPTPAMERIRAELTTVENFARRAKALPHDSKARALVETLRIVRDRARKGEGTGKAVIFTESLTTQAYLQELLLESGVSSAEITLFSGNNERPESCAALERWVNDVSPSLPAGQQPSHEVAMRLALVHEFRERSHVFISTEAGGKGLNLQFCDTLINYDLPWNPQRIEQRIGRVHRYGQRRGVTVISFVARDNEAQRLTFDILTQKMDLFGRVLDASDVILHEPATHTPQSLISALSIDFETQLRRIYDQARSIDDVTHELRALREEIEAKRQEFDTEQARAAELVEERLDDRLHAIFRKYEHEIPSALAGLDADIERLVTSYLSVSGCTVECSESPGRVLLRIAPVATLPDGYRDGASVVIGDTKDLADGDVLHLGHPLVRAAVDESRQTSRGELKVVFLPKGGALPSSIEDIKGRRGRLIATKVSYRGIEPGDELVLTAMLESSDGPMDPDVLRILLSMAAADAPELEPVVFDGGLEDLVAEALLENQSRSAAREHDRFERMLGQLDRYLEDQAMLLRRNLTGIQQRVDDAERRRERALSAAARVKEDETIIALRNEAHRTAERIRTVERGQDADYEAWRGRLYERRFRKPHTERLLDVQFQIDTEGQPQC